MAKKGKKKTTWVFDIDSKLFTKKIKDSRKKLNELGDPKNLEGLKQGLIQVTAGSIAFLAIAKTIKATLDLAFRADKIKEINSQFNILTQNAGIAGDELKFQLEEAGRGLLSTNELLDITNKTLLSLGKSAAVSMPKLIELADKVASSMGGNLKDRLDQLNAAITSGSAASFEQIGILLDEQKVLRDYAKSIGTTVDVLSQAGKRQAFLNAALTTGAQKFKEVDSSVSKNIDAWAGLQSALTDFGDAFSEVFEEIIGPSLERYLLSLKGWTKFFKNEFLKAASDGIEGQKLRVADLQKAVQELGFETNILNAEDLRWWENKKTRDTNLLVLQEKKKRAVEELAKGQAKLNEMIGKQPAPGGDDADEGIDTAKEKTRKARFENELLALRKNRIDQEIALNMTVEDADRLHNEQRAIIQEEFQIKLDELQAKEDEGLLRTGERLRIETELYAQRTNALIAQDQRLDETRTLGLDNWVKNSKTAAEGFSSAMTSASRKAAMEQKNFGKQATFAINSFQGHATNAFLALGEGSKNLGEAMSGFVLGALADIAENHGKLYLLQGFTNPALFGAGAALIALAGFLRSKAGAGGGAGGGGGGASSGGGGGDFAPTAPETEVTPIAEEPEKKKVEINFHGDYLETEATQQRFVDIIREAGDVQEFLINKID